MKGFIKVSVSVLTVVFGFGFSGLIAVHAATAPSLGVADGYSVFGKAGVTNTGVVTHVWGNAGADALVGLISSQVGGSIVANGDTVGVATAASAAYDNLDLGSQGTPASLDLAGNNTVVPGVYTVGATTLNGTLTLNGAGVYIFRSSSSISTSGAGTMNLINGATACNVFWEIPASMTIGTNAHIEGTIIAKTGLISLATGATLKGRAISLISQVTLDSNQITQPTCTAAPATLHIIKTVINDNSGTAMASSFNLHVKFSGADVAGSPAVGIVSPGRAYTISAGTYIVSEDVNSSYVQSFSGDCDANGSVTLSAGETKTCTITNNDITPAPATLQIVKHVINDNGGTAIASNFTINVTGTNVSSSSFAGSEAGTDVTLDAGAYSIAETGPTTSYTQSNSADCSGTIAGGETKNCTITNDDIGPVPATLQIVKHVINDNGGTAIASNFTINVTGTNVSSSSFAGSEAGTNVTLDAGAYSIAETGPAGYTQSDSADCSGTIAAGTTKTCTITNNDIFPRLTVTKIVVNDSGRTKVIADFSLFVNSTAVNSGVTNVFPVGTGYAVSETTDPGYTRTFSGDCNATTGLVDLALGDNKTCFVTNNDIAPSSGGGGYSSRYYPPVPPIIDVVKVPSPLSLPAGPGLVEYTYTLRNIGTVPVTDITMVGDTCSPIVLVSGDTNSDAKLDLTETWVHTCSTTLSVTHTNTVVATGWANGISATDIASATVVVSVPIVPPLIHVTKVPSPLTLPAGGGAVTYNYVVTNPGSEPLSDVAIVDDKCTGLPGRVIGHPGDLNGNNLLETNETWSFTCQSDLIQTTTNTATASGVANGLTARDFAIAHVVVANAVLAVPSFPNAGFALEKKSVLSNIIILYGVFVIISVLIVLALRKRRI